MSNLRVFSICALIVVISGKTLPMMSSIRVNQQSVSIFPIFSKKENWMKKWLFGNSEQPLNMAQLMVKHNLKKLNITILTL